MAKKDNIVFYGTGRRKDAIARVRVVEGNGNITIGALPVGFYNVLANYSGNLNTNSVVNSTAFNVTKTGSFLNVSVDDIVVGNDEIIRISVPEDATGNITVIVDDVNLGDFIKVKITDATATYLKGDVVSK